MWRRSILGAINRPFVAAGPTYDADAQAIFDEMTTPPDDTRKGLINDAVVALKSAGVWALRDAIYVIAAADSQAAYLNWKNPTETPLVVNGTSGTFTVDRGYAGSATGASHLDGPTAFSSMSNWARDDANLSIYCTTDTQQSPSLVGVLVSDNIGINPRNSGNTTRYRINNSTTGLSPSSTNGIGMYSINRTGASAIEGFKDGASTGAGTDASVAVVAEALSIGRCNGNTNTNQVAYVALGSSLTATEIDDEYTAILAYLVGVGAA